MRARERQQAGIAALGQRALNGVELTALMEEAVALVADTLETDCCGVFEFLPDGTALRLRAGVGWRPGLVGRATVGAGGDTLVGQTLGAGEPAIVAELGAEARFDATPLLLDHGVVGGLSAVVHGLGRDPRPFGVLGAWTTRRRAFTAADAHVLQAVANVLAAAVGRAAGSSLVSERLAALARIAASLTVDQPMAATLSALAASVVGTTEAVACGVKLIDAGTDELSLAGAHGLPPDFEAGVAAAWRAGADLWARRAVEARRLVIDGGVRRAVLADPRAAPLHDLLREAPWDLVVSVPLVYRGEVVGTLTGYYPEGAGPADDEVAFLGAVADEAAVAVENARLYERAQRAAALEERQRLARELHDSLSQSLYAIGLGVGAARMWLDSDPAEAVEPIEYVRGLAGSALAELRSIIFELRPESLAEEGLTAALTKRVAALRARHGLAMETELCPEPDVPLEVKDALYRVGQEALHNAAKHARASRVTVRLRAGDGELALEVADDGRGFEPTQAFPGHLGLRSMQERVQQIGGTVAVESAPGRGTLVRARVPLRSG